jgi:hypothetical protein
MQAPRPTDQAEAPIPPVTVSNDPIPPEIVREGPDENLNGTVIVRRKAAKRSLPFDLAAGELHEHLMPSLWSPQAEDIPAVARKKPRLEEPLPTTTDLAARKTASPDVSVGLPLPAADNDDDDLNADPVTDTQPNDRDTTVTRRFWTLEEDAKLTSAVTNTAKKKHGKEYRTDWVVIAALVPGRTRFQCFHRWQHFLDPSIDRTNRRTGKWTEDEDIKLKDAVQTHGGKNWVAIAAMVPCRAQKQCRSRWHDVLKQKMDRANGRTGKWTEDEDIKLKDAVQLHGGKDWAAITALVPGRTKKQCSRRWDDVLNPSIALTAGCTGKWTTDEDSKLKDAVQTHSGKNWDAISALVSGRTKVQCYNRWHKTFNPRD